MLRIDAQRTDEILMDRHDFQHGAAPSRDIGMR